MYRCVSPFKISFASIFSFETPIGSHDVRIKVLASGINYFDLLTLVGKYQHRPELPFTPVEQKLELWTFVINIGRWSFRNSHRSRLFCSKYQSGWWSDGGNGSGCLCFWNGHFFSFLSSQASIVFPWGGGCISGWLYDGVSRVLFLCTSAVALIISDTGVSDSFNGDSWRKGKPFWSRVLQVAWVCLPYSLAN